MTLSDDRIGARLRAVTTPWVLALVIRSAAAADRLKQQAERMVPAIGRFRLGARVG